MDIRGENQMNKNVIRIVAIIMVLAMIAGFISALLYI